MAKRQILLIPGDVLKELLEEYQINITRLANYIGLSVSAVRQIVNNKAKVSLHIAKRLSKYFSTDVEYWINMQHAYDLAELDRDPEFTEILKSIPKAKKPGTSTRGRKAAEKTPPKKSRGKTEKQEVAVTKTRKPRARKVKPDAAEELQMAEDE